MKCVYISGPYSSSTPAGKQKNIHHAWEASLAIWKIPGVYAICPHTNTQYMDGDVEYEKFMEGDLDLVRRVDAVFMLKGWSESKGAMRERALAYEIGLPVFYEGHTTEEEFKAWLAPPQVKLEILHPLLNQAVS